MIGMQKELEYCNQDICLQGELSPRTMRFSVIAVGDRKRLGDIVLLKQTAQDGRVCGVLRFALLPSYCLQRWYEAVFAIAERHFFVDFDLSLLLCEVDPETDQQKIAALVSYGYGPDREHLTDKTDMFVLHRAQVMSADQK